MWLVDRGGRAPSGFLKLVAFVDAGAIAAALALVPTFPGGDLAARAGVDTGPLAAFGQALVLVTILIVIQLVTTFLPVRGLRLAAGLVTLLGHWYLVTPKLSPGPLRSASLAVVTAVTFQIGLVAIVWLRGDLTGTWETALSVALALRIGVGLFMTLVVAVAAWWTAGMNTQSSTGLLYVALGCAFAGEVSARVIFFLTGVPI